MTQDVRMVGLESSVRAVLLKDYPVSNSDRFERVVDRVCRLPAMRRTSTLAARMLYLIDCAIGESPCGRVADHLAAMRSEAMAAFQETDNPKDL